MNKVMYGMPTLIECSDLNETVRLCKELKLDFIEINMNLPQYQKNKVNIEELKEIVDQEKIYFTIHLDEKLDVCDFNEDVSKAYLKAVEFAIQIAKKLEIPVITMHMAKGVYFTLPEGKIFLYEKYREEYLTKLLNFREFCEEQIGKAKIKISIENTSGFQEFMKEGIELLLESEVFGLTWDIGHDYVLGGKDRLFIDKHINRLTHMHVHDVKKGKDHLPLGDGEIDIESRLKVAKKYNCRCVLEVKTIDGLKRATKYIKNY